MAEMTEQEVQQQVDAAGKEAEVKAEAKGLTADEVNAAVEKARKEEKDKLYPQIEALKDAMKEVQEALKTEREEKERVRKDAEAKAETDRVAQLSADERQLEILNRLEEQLKQEREERIQLKAELDEKERTSLLKAYRERALAAAGDDILPELKDIVRGNTEVEIDNAIRIAKSRTEEIVKRFKESRGREVKNSLGGVANPDMAALEEQELSEQLSTIDRDKYMRDAEYRERVQNELSNAYNRSVGR